MSNELPLEGSVHWYLLFYGTDKDMSPDKNVERGITAAPEPTDHAPGSPGKLEELRRRVECGQPMWLAEDRDHCEGLTPADVPRTATNARHPLWKTANHKRVYRDLSNLREDDR